MVPDVALLECGQAVLGLAQALLRLIDLIHKELLRGGRILDFAAQDVPNKIVYQDRRRRFRLRPRSAVAIRQP